MKITGLHIENTMRIKVADIPQPDGNMVVLTGKNAQGKSSTLKAMFWALGGPKAMQLDQVVREGEDKAIVEVDLGQYKVTRTQTAGGTMSLKVETAEGAKFSSPQALLDTLISKNSIDPIRFIAAAPKEQVETLLGLVELGFDPAEMDAKIKAIFDERTATGRRIKQLEGQLAGLAEPDSDLPDEPVGASELLAELDAANQAIADKRRAFEKMMGLRRDLANGNERIAQLESELAEMHEHLAVVEQMIDEQGRELDAMPEPGTEAIKARLADIDGLNAKVRAKRDYFTVRDELATCRQLAGANTASIEEFEAKKRKALAKAKFPVAGLGFGDGCVTFNGVPLSQASSAEQIKVSMAIAMALNPELKVIHIAAGSLLDSASMEIIEDLARANDYQVWIEKVDESGKVGIYFEDGEIAAINAAEIDLSDY